jgi:hypothetical protein
LPEKGHKKHTPDLLIMRISGYQQLSAREYVSKTLFVCVFERGYSFKDLFYLSFKHIYLFGPALWTVLKMPSLAAATLRRSEKNRADLKPFY